METKRLKEEEKKLVNVKYASCSLMMGIPNKELDGLPSPGLMFCHTSSQVLLKMEANTD